MIPWARRLLVTVVTASAVTRLQHAFATGFWTVCTCGAIQSVWPGWEHGYKNELIADCLDYLYEPPGTPLAGPFNA